MRPVPEKIRAKLMLAEALVARGTLRDRVPPAVPEEQDAFFAGQLAGPLTVEMHHTIVAELNGIVGRDQLEATRALRFSHLPAPPSRALP
jgi:hypothetical protein